MLDHREIARKAQKLTALLEARLRVTAPTLAGALRRAAHLPRHIRSQAEVIVAAQRQVGSPLAERRIDAATVRAAYREVSGYLRALDPAALRRSRRRQRLATAAEKLALVACGFAVWSWVQGLA